MSLQLWPTRASRLDAMRAPAPEARRRKSKRLPSVCFTAML